MKFSILEWIMSIVRRSQMKPEEPGKHGHSVVMKVYDNGRLVFLNEIDYYEIDKGRADDLYLVGRMNARISDMYGKMHKRTKEAMRRIRKGGAK